MSQLRESKFLKTLVLEFKKAESDDQTKYCTFYLNSQVEEIINEINIDDVFESTCITIISNIQKYLGKRGFIKSTDLRPTEYRPTDHQPLTHRPIDAAIMFKRLENSKYIWKFLLHQLFFFSFHSNIQDSFNQTLFN